MAEQFYTLMTDIGLAKITNGLINEKKVDFTHMAVGDGGGSYYNPSSSQTKLAREVWRGPIGIVDTDEEDRNRIQIVAPIPSVVGGFFIREVGLYDADGDLIVIAKHPETYKPIIDNGSIKDLSIKLLIEVANSSSIVMKIDPTVIIATRKYVDDKVDGLNTNLTKLDNRVTTHLDEFAQSLTDSGYQKIPNGFIIQWATYGPYGDVDQDVSKLVNFPIAFPNRAFNVCAVIYSNALTLKRYIQILSNNDSQITFVAKGIEAVGGTNTGSYYVKVIAIGN